MGAVGGSCRTRWKFTELCGVDGVLKVLSFKSRVHELQLSERMQDSMVY